MAGSTITQGSTSFLDKLNPTNWFQQKPDTSAYTVGQFAPQNTSGTGNASSMWNQGWTAGYNNSTGSNPYSDVNQSAGFLQGQKDFFAQKGRSTGRTGGTVNNPVTPTNIQTGGGVDLNAQLRSQIEGGYNDYLSNLNNMYSGLTTQAEAQNTIAQNSYDQSIKDLLANKESSLVDLGTSQRKVEEAQVKNLRDIASNIQNQYMAGNVMLGARGAGDSSAANQYSYALNRLGSKARGDVMNTTASSIADLDAQRSKLNNIVTQETSRLDTELANTKKSISSWLAEQQNAVREMIGQGQLNKSKDIASLTQNLLNQALSAYQTKQNEIANSKATLQTWAANNATNINQLAKNMQSIGQFTPTMSTFGGINGNVTTDSQGNVTGLYNTLQGYGTSTEDKLKQLLGY